jgi:NAD(P)-dependent dehydrogenase (short-subunit alcohol dehydrogenase family)
METAMIAGVGPGTGAALARIGQRRLRRGLAFRDAESSDPVAAEISARASKALVVSTDVTDRQSVASAVNRIRSDFGPITKLAQTPAATAAPIF